MQLQTGRARIADFFTGRLQSICNGSAIEGIEISKETSDRKSNAKAMEAMGECYAGNAPAARP
jgi:hypothetical protein